MKIVIFDMEPSIHTKLSKVKVLLQPLYYYYHYRGKQETECVTHRLDKNICESGVVT